MIFIYFILTFLIGVSIGGFLQKKLTIKAIEIENQKAILLKKNNFLEILSNIKSGNSNFKTRVNETIYVELNLNDYGVVDLIYLMDKNDIAVFQDSKCIHTSDGIQKEIISEIISTICFLYDKKINDVVNLFGFTFYREEFENSFNIKMEDIKNMNFFNQTENLNEIDKIKSDNKKKFDVDEILDKISAYGIQGLTNEELIFLDKFSNEKGD